MTAARTDILDILLEEHYTLTHITEYVQPKNEWFDVMRRREFTYHQINETAASVELNGSSAVVTGRGIFDATINGMRRPWRLAFTMRFVRSSAGWVATRARYTTW